MTGASSGRAREGAKVAVSRRSDPQDTEETLCRTREFGVEDAPAGVDTGIREENARASPAAIEKPGGSLDILVGKASVQTMQEGVSNVSPEQARDAMGRS